MKIKAKGRAKALPIFYSVGGFNAVPLYYNEVLGTVWALQKMELEENGRKEKRKELVTKFDIAGLVTKFDNVDLVTKFDNAQVT